MEITTAKARPEPSMAGWRKRSRDPGIWPLELGNGSLIAEGRKPEDELRDCQSRSNQGLPVTVSSLSCHLRRSNGVTACAAYLELAIREMLPLATLDDELEDAARYCGITVVSMSAVDFD